MLLQRTIALLALANALVAALLLVQAFGGLKVLTLP